MKKRTFFERLTATPRLAEDYDAFEEDADDAPVRKMSGVARRDPGSSAVGTAPTMPEPVVEGQLPVDVLQTPSELIIRAFVAGVRGDGLDISLSRDMITISGARSEPSGGDPDDDDYFTRELYWGAFTRTVLLPQEIDIESASATTKDGLLTLILPKLDKAKQTKLRVKSN